jgi:hypothetical protein
MALGKGFPECSIFATRGRPLPRDPLPRLAFPECCTQGSLSLVFWGLARVLLTLEEGGGSRSMCFIDMAEKYKYKTTTLGDHRQEKQRKSKLYSPGWIDTSTPVTT